MSGFLSLTATSSGIFCCAYLFGEKNAWIFCNGDIVTKTTNSNNTNGSSTNFAGISAVHTRASCYTGIPTLLMSPKIQVKRNRYHNDVHCTYCKHRTKRRISGIESPLHSCWDKTTIKNRRGGSGTPEWNPPLATPLLPGRKKALNPH